LKAKKRLGQNFLVDETIRDRIIESAEISAADTVVEVGPGTGVLTEKLAASAGRVVAVELDESLAARLMRKLAGSQNVEIIHDNILDVELKGLLGDSVRYKVVANIPYYITSPILRYFTQNELKPELMVIMMQEEVAKDVAAKPGHMTFLSASMQVFSKPEIVIKVPAESFDPRPKVDSAVVRFVMLKKPSVPVSDIEGFLEFLHAGFGAPRKQMRNSLAVGLKIETQQAGELLNEADIDPQRRPGMLTLEEWFNLYRCVEEGRC
jgi:16S rRNA (adenine1518-N6/adenine1519-N6)-dimethyltransferase